jgi:tetratricopeptide (TPR) repeat protein
MNIMNRVWILAAILTLAIPVFAQQAQQSQQTQQTPQAQQAQKDTAQTSQAPDNRPKVKSQAEMDAYKAAFTNPDPAAVEKAANDFATQFPDSELKPILYRAAMHAYERQNNTKKAVEMGEGVLKYDPDDPEALILVAQVLAQNPGTGADMAQNVNQAMQYARHAIVTVDTNLPPKLPADKVDIYKGMIRSSAYSIVGALQYNMQQYADAEASFRQSLDALPSQPDAVVVLRLALALEKEQKYPEALKEAKRAVDMTQENTGVGQMARRERDRLAPLAKNGGAAPASQTPAGTQTPSAPKQ